MHRIIVALMLSKIPLDHREANEFVDNHQPEANKVCVAHVRALARNDIPLLRGCNDDLGLYDLPFCQLVASR